MLVSGNIIKAAANTENDKIALGASMSIVYFLIGFIKSMIGNIINADITVIQAANIDRKSNDNSIQNAIRSPNNPNRV